MGAAILRVLALDEGNASVNLMISASEACRKEEEKASPGSHHALASGSALVRVILRDTLMASVQNDARTGHGSRMAGQSAIRPDAATQSYMLPHAPPPPPLSSNQIIGGEDHKRKMAVDPQIMIKVRSLLTSAGVGDRHLVPSASSALLRHPHTSVKPCLSNSSSIHSSGGGEELTLHRHLPVEILL